MDAELFLENAGRLFTFIGITGTILGVLGWACWVTGRLCSLREEVERNERWASHHRDKDFEEMVDRVKELESGLHSDD